MPADRPVRTAMPHRHATRRACQPFAVDMMDNASALPTCPQRQQQQKTAVRKWAKITHTTSRRGFIILGLRGIEWVIFELKKQESWGLQGDSAFSETRNLA